MSLGEITGHVDLDASSLDDLTSAAVFASLAYLTVFFASIVVISMWIHLAHANLLAFSGASLEFSPASSVGWFFVPIANLFKPFQAMRELWNVSHGRSGSFDAPANSWLVPWWGAWIVGSFLSEGSANSGLYPGVSPVIIVADLAGNIALMACAWFLLRIVEAVTNAQRSGLGMSEVFA